MLLAIFLLLLMCLWVLPAIYTIHLYDTLGILSPRYMAVLCALSGIAGLLYYAILYQQSLRFRVIKRSIADVGTVTDTPVKKQEMN